MAEMEETKWAGQREGQKREFHEAVVKLKVKMSRGSWIANRRSKADEQGSTGASRCHLEL